MQVDPGTRPAAHPGRLPHDAVRRVLDALFWGPLALAALLVAVWPPRTVDGPAHLLGAAVLAGHGDPGTAFARFYLIDWSPTPNLAGSAVLAALLELGSLRFAETVLLVACAVGPPLAVRFAVRAVDPAAGWLGVAALPLSFGYLYFYGFYNFCLALALCLLCVGVALRAAPRWSVRATAGLAALLTATWFTHLVPFALAVLFLACLVAAGPRPGHGAEHRVRAVLAPAVTVLPGVALTLAYLVRTEQGSSPTWDSPAGHLLGLLTLHAPLVTFSRWENLVAALVAAVLITVAVLARRSRPDRGEPAGRSGRAGRVTASAAALAALGYLLAPTSLGIDFGVINERLSFFPVLFGLLWLAVRPLPPRRALAGALALVTLTGALLAVRLPDLRRYDRLADEYASAARFVDDGSTLVALRLSAYPPGAGRNSHWDPLRHLSSRLAAATGSVDVGHYEAVFDYFPARFRASADLRRAIDPGLDGLSEVPPDVDLTAAQNVLGGPIDYVLLVGAGRAPAGSAPTLRAELERRYERIGVTAPTGLIEVWAARGR